MATRTIPETLIVLERIRAKVNPEPPARPEGMTDDNYRVMAALYGDGIAHLDHAIDCLKRGIAADAKAGA